MITQGDAWTVSVPIRPGRDLTEPGNSPECSGNVILWLYKGWPVEVCKDVFYFFYFLHKDNIVFACMFWFMERSPNVRNVGTFE